jgi:hypothetical protein
MEGPGSIACYMGAIRQFFAHSALDEARALDRMAMEDNPLEWIETSEDDDPSQVAHSASRGRSESDTDDVEVDTNSASKHLEKSAISRLRTLPVAAVRRRPLALDP